MAYTYYYTQPTSTEDTTNPTAVTQSTKEFGDNTSQYNVDPFMQPFPFEEQKQELADYRQRFGDWLGNLETPEATRQRFENRYGYQPLQEEYLRSSEMLGDLSSAIRAKPEQVASRGRETIMTSGQLENITSKEVADLMKVYESVGTLNEQQGNRLALIEQNMNTAAQLELAQQEKMSQPWLMEYSDLQILQARQMEGWTTANRLELDRLLSNQAAGLNWTQGEADRANELAIAEKGFANALEQIRLQGETDINVWKKTEGVNAGLSNIFSSYGF